MFYIVCYISAKGTYRACMETFASEDMACHWAEHIAARDRVRSWVVQVPKPPVPKPELTVVKTEGE
jgi:hypothetical protein